MDLADQVRATGETTGRSTSAMVDSLFVERWSPRSFTSDSIDESTIMSIFEAARWAPSASNLQPAMFVYADLEPELQRVRPILNDFNRLWADRAPLLIFVFARMHEPETGAHNVSAAFDTGAAWMSLALQASKMGLVTHAMGGIHHDLAYELLEVPREEYALQCAIAVGRRGPIESLPPELRERETPSTRRELDKFLFRGTYAGPTRPVVRNG
jgi:nitroreductase